MTKETRTLIEFGDVLSLQLECLKCGTKVTRPVGNTAHFPIRCESCRGEAEWFVSEQDANRLALANFSRQLENLRELGRELQKRGLKIALEIKSE